MRELFVLAGVPGEVQDAIGSIVEPKSSNVTDNDTQATLRKYDDNNLPNHVNQSCNADIKLDKHIVDFNNPHESQFGQGSNPFNDISIAVHDLTIPWCELVLKEKIGAGISIPLFICLYICERDIDNLVLQKP